MSTVREREAFQLSPISIASAISHECETVQMLNSSLTLAASNKNQFCAWLVDRNAVTMREYSGNHSI
jgi:hypothetical protein